MVPSCGKTWHSDASFMIGECNYEGGYGIVKNYFEAKNWYQIAAEHGHTEAAVKTAECYVHGIGVERDHKQAIKWYKIAAEQGNSNAEYMMGEEYWKDQDYDKAVKWYSLAAEHDNGDAALKISECYFYGYGVEIDYEESVKWLYFAYELNNVSAMLTLGIYTMQKKGIPEIIELWIKNKRWMYLDYDN